MQPFCGSSLNQFQFACRDFGDGLDIRALRVSTAFDIFDGVGVGDTGPLGTVLDCMNVAGGKRFVATRGGKLTC